MSNNAPYRPTHFGPVAANKEVRPDGTVLYQTPHEVESYPTRVTERLLHWAKVAPERVFLARRNGAANSDAGNSDAANSNSAWQSLTYAETLTSVRAIAQALLGYSLSSDRTIAILSENSLEHGLLALAAIHVGIPYAPISPPYSLLSKDFGKLRHTLQLMTPGLIFASDGQRYEKALRVAHQLFPDATIVLTQNPLDDLPSVAFADLMSTAAMTPSAMSAVDAAFDRVTADTVAKVLFTSGSTNMPKGVMNTHRLWSSSLQQCTQILPFLQETPPIFVDWLPWNHTFGSNHNFGLALYNGGSLYIDEGKPTPQGIETTIANLRELSPTAYFNVPKGYAELIPYLRREPALRETFFAQLEMFFYAGAALPQSIWDALEDLAAETTGYRVPIITGIGMTESGPSATFAHWPGGYSGLLGTPVPGLTIKLVPDDDKMEARYRGPNVTPGYWRQPELNATSFDEEGYFRTGDAVKFVDEDEPSKGLIFDGRIAEDFKLTSGTWVNVGILRMQLLKAGAPLVQDSVITGHNRDDIGAILFLNLDECRALAGMDGSVMAAATVEELAQQPAVRERIQALLDTLAQSATGSSNRIVRAVIATFAPSIDVGEVTDKGSLNQRVVLRHRADWVEALYAESMPDNVFTIQGK